MATDVTFRLMLGGELALITAIRTGYQLAARRRGGRFVRAEPDWQAILKSGLALISSGAVLIYLLSPEWLAWADLFWPEGLRWLGVGLGLLAAGLHWGSHHALGANFSPFLGLGERQTLTRHGVYRRIRHPLYTAFFLTGLTCFLVTANWFIGLTWAGFALMVSRQVSAEEAMMLAKFGETYRRYMQSTGRFWPKIYG